VAEAQPGDAAAGAAQVVQLACEGDQEHDTTAAGATAAVTFADMLHYCGQAHGMLTASSRLMSHCSLQRGRFACASSQSRGVMMSSTDIASNKWSTSPVAHLSADNCTTGCSRPPCRRTASVRRSLQQ
jgi:hypothetical protein